MTGNKQRNYSVGLRLRDARRRQNLSLTDVENAIGLHFSTIARYERNERQPSLEVLRELAELYEVSLTELFQDPEDLLIMLPPEAAEGARVALRRPGTRALFPLLLQMDDRQLVALQQLIESFLKPLNADQP